MLGRVLLVLDIRQTEKSRRLRRLLGWADTIFGVLGGIATIARFILFLLRLHGVDCG